MDHSQRTAIVVGATGALGRAVTGLLRARGVRVGIAVRRPWQVEGETKIHGRDGVLVGCVPSGDGEAAAGFAKGVRDALGPIDALFCCNGAFRAAEVGADPQDELSTLLEANLVAAATMARAVVPTMKRRQSGSLLFVGSAQVGRGGSGMANYLASKAALHEYVRALAAELQGSGVRVHAVLPGTLDTPANRKDMAGADTASWLPLEQVAERMLGLAFEPAAAAPTLLAI